MNEKNLTSFCRTPFRATKYASKTPSWNSVASPNRFILSYGSLGRVLVTPAIFNSLKPQFPSSGRRGRHLLKSWLFLQVSSQSKLWQSLPSRENSAQPSGLWQGAVLQRRQRQRSSAAGLSRVAGFVRVGWIL